MDNKGVEYVGIKDKVFPEFFKKHPHFRPTAKTGKFFGTIFVLVVVIGFVFVNWFSLFSMSLDIEVKVGLPMTFFDLSLQHPETLPIQWVGLIVDLLLYLILAYFADVLCNYIYQRIEVAKEKKRPEVYKVK